MTTSPTASGTIVAAGRRRQSRRPFKLPVPALIGAGIFLLLVLAAIFAPLLAQYPPSERVGAPSLPPSAAHWFGTTAQSQDVFSQFVYGARVSLGVSVAVAVITTVFGLIIGLWAAYAGGWVDSILSLIANVFLVLPSLALIVVLAAFLPPGPLSIVLVLSVTGWSFGARLFRSQALTLRQRDYVVASEVGGESRTRIIFVELLPNMWSIVAAFFVNQIVFAITAESSLEFLGLGNPGTVSWGTMLYWAQNSSALLLGHWWQFVIPGLAIAFTAFSLALINFAVDEQGNPRLKATTLLRNALGFRLRSATLITPVVIDHDK
jgi:peptide/nickel transport system permease protein